jgi:group I intron endonuclease
MIIYLITNLVNLKIYVGKTAQNLHDRWLEHISKSRSKKKQEYLYRAMRKTGVENFHIQEIAVATTVEQLNELEKLWIFILRSNDPKIGYNMTSGGEGVPLVGEAKERHRLSAVKYAQTEKGKKHHKRIAKLVSKALKGKPKPSEQRAKIASYWGTNRRAEQSAIVTAYNLKANAELHDYKCDKCGEEFKQVTKGVFGGHRRVCLNYR